MSDYPYLYHAIAWIACTTRDNVEWGARAFQIWKQHRRDPDHPHELLDPAQCVWIAQQELYMGRTDPRP